MTLKSVLRVDILHTSVHIIFSAHQVNLGDAEAHGHPGRRSFGFRSHPRDGIEWKSVILMVFGCVFVEGDLQPVGRLVDVPSEWDQTDVSLFVLTEKSSGTELLHPLLLSATEPTTAFFSDSQQDSTSVFRAPVVTKSPVEGSKYSWIAGITIINDIKPQKNMSTGAANLVFSLAARRRSSDRRWTRSLRAKTVADRAKPFSRLVGAAVGA